MRKVVLLIAVFLIGFLFRHFILTDPHLLLSPFTVISWEEKVKRNKIRNQFKTPIAAYPKHHSVWENNPLEISYSSHSSNKSSKVLKINIWPFGQKAKVKEIKLNPFKEIGPGECITYVDKGCDFKFKMNLETKDLEPGPYLLVLEDENGGQSNEVFFVVLPNKENIKNYPLAVMFPTFTWSAYNQMGGASTYYPAHEDGYSVVSLLRPNIQADKIHSHFEMQNLINAVREVTPRLFAITSEDLHRFPQILKHLKVLVLTGHDEYYSGPMKENLHRAMEKGMNLAAFSGNTMWWKLNYKFPNIYVFKGYSSGPKSPIGKYGKMDANYKSSGNFFALNEPEEEVIGLSYRFAGYPLSYGLSYGSHPNNKKAFGITDNDLKLSKSMEVTLPNHPVFTDTNLKKFDRFGENTELVGFEIDGLPLTLTHPEKINYIRAPNAPKNLKILAKSLIYNMYSQPGSPIVRVATAIEFSHEKGKVIHMGSANWYKAIGPNHPKTTKIFKNTLNYLLK